MFARNFDKYSKNSKATSITGRTGLWTCETSKLQHFPDNQLTDGGEIVSFKLWSLFTTLPQGKFLALASVRG